jgi:hypothetical protein
MGIWPNGRPRGKRPPCTKVTRTPFFRDLQSGWKAPGLDEGAGPSSCRGWQPAGRWKDETDWLTAHSTAIRRPARSASCPGRPWKRNPRQPPSAFPRRINASPPVAHERPPAAFQLTSYRLPGPLSTRASIALRIGSDSVGQAAMTRASSGSFPGSTCKRPVSAGTCRPNSLCCLPVASSHAAFPSWTSPVRIRSPALDGTS